MASNTRYKEFKGRLLSFWLSLIACLLAYNAGIAWLTCILVVMSILNLISMIIIAWKEVKKRKEIE